MRNVPFPDAHELQAAQDVLSLIPVVGYGTFTEAEVHAIGVYRLAVSQGAYDAVWRGIVGHAPEAWVYAVHEAAELQAFVDLTINPFDAIIRQLSLLEAHTHAVIVELQY